MDAITSPCWCPSSSRAPGVTLVFFFFKWLHFISSEFQRSRFTLSTSDHCGFILNFALDSSRSPRLEKFSDYGCRRLHFACSCGILSPWSKHRGAYSSFVPWSFTSRYFFEALKICFEVQGFNIVCLDRGLIRSSEWEALLYLFIQSIVWAPNSEHRTRTILLEEPECKLRLKSRVWFQLYEEANIGDSALLLFEEFREFLMGSQWNLTIAKFHFRAIVVGTTPPSLLVPNLLKNNTTSAPKGTAIVSNRNGRSSMVGPLL